MQVGMSVSTSDNEVEENGSTDKLGLLFSGHSERMICESLSERSKIFLIIA